MTNALYYSAIASKERIDAEKGVIYGVSVITAGEAEGKNAGTWIDSTTLSQMAKVAAGFPHGVKVKLSQAKEHDGSAGQIVGALRSFRIDGNQVRADLHLLKNDSQFSKIIEMSSTMPTEFGLSVAIPKRLVKVDGKECLRVEDIYSVDIVEAPAANPGGLFSQQTSTQINMSSIKYAKGESGDHAKDCDCKECMSKQSKREMSQHLAALFGLSVEGKEDAAIDAEIMAFTSKIGKPQDLTALTAKITEHETKLSTFEAANANAVKLAKDAEIKNLIAEASKDGKVVPLTDAQLSKMDIVDVREMFAKLPKGQLRLSKTQTTSSTSVPSFKTADERIEFCRTQRDAGAAQLTAQYATSGLITI
jgi:hypothetical protein